MKLKLYEIGQYTDTKRFYISRLKDIDDHGTITRTIVQEGMRTSEEAHALKAELDSKGLKGVRVSGLI